jgi:hypothetical protein
MLKDGTFIGVKQAGSSLPGREELRKLLISSLETARRSDEAINS